jgi:hypothetical protein
MMASKKANIDPAIPSLEKIISDPDYRLRHYVGDITITRNAMGGITQIVIQKGGWIRTITVDRDANNLITAISEKQVKYK